MGTIRSQFAAGSLMYDEMGTVTGSVSAVQMATGSCSMVRFKADADNVGTFKLGQELKVRIVDVNIAGRTVDLVPVV